jgi:NADPH:quinone reductase-like Zn-dependent oxidoreductase
VRAAIFERNGDPSDVLAIGDLPDPAPGPGEVLVRVRLSPVHASDLHIMRGRFGRQPALPASPGVECVGVVEALGLGVSGPTVGTRVVLLNVWGCWRELVVSAADRVVVVPDDVSDEDAAQALINPVTAWVMAMVEHGLKPGDWLAQTAAGSTVGQLVLQLASTEQFRTINIVPRRKQMPEITALGGNVVISTEDEGWADQLAKAQDGFSPSKAIDCVAGRVGAALARCLAPGGRQLVYGALSSHRQTDPAAFEMPVFASRLIYSAATVQGWYLFHWLEITPLADCAKVLAIVLNRLASGDFNLPPAKRHRLEELGGALKDAEDTGRQGKPLLDFAGGLARDL